MIREMHEDTAAGFIESLGKGDQHATAGSNGARMQPYPAVDGLMTGEPLGAGLQPSDLSASAAIGNMTTGSAKGGMFSGPAKIGPGNMISDMISPNGGAEDTFPAAQTGDLVTGMPMAGMSTAAAEVHPDGLVTGSTKAGMGTGHGVNGGQ